MKPHNTILNFIIYGLMILGIVLIALSFFIEKLQNYAVVLTFLLACASIILKLRPQHDEPMVDVLDNFSYSEGGCSISFINLTKSLAKDIYAKLDGVDKVYEQYQMYYYKDLHRELQHSRYTARFPLPDITKFCKIRHPKFIVIWRDTFDGEYERVYPIIQGKWESEDPATRNKVKVVLDKRKGKFTKR